MKTLYRLFFFGGFIMPDGLDSDRFEKRVDIVKIFVRTGVGDFPAGSVFTFLLSGVDIF